MSHMFPCFREKPTFSTRDASIDKRNLILLNGRAVFHCRHKSFREKFIPTDRKNKFQILIICENKLSKAELYKSNFVKKITECISCHFKNLHIFLPTFLKFLFIFIIPLFALNFIFLMQISSSITFTCFFSACVKPIQNVIIKNEKIP